MSEHVRTIREAIIAALEGLPGSAEEWVSNTNQLIAMRSYIRDWCSILLAIVV
jgi:hypothetical protein